MADTSDTIFCAFIWMHVLNMDKVTNNEVCVCGSNLCELHRLPLYGLYLTM